MRPFDGVIFDFNGVLLWDNHLHEETWRRYSTLLRGVALTGEEMKHAVHGRVNRDIFAFLLGRPPSDAELRPLMEEKEAVYRQLALEAIDSYHLSSGAVELLDFLVAHHVPRAIATSSPAVNVTFFIEHLDLLRWFAPDHIIYDRGLYPGKPAPGIYLEAAGRLGQSPGSYVVVEDSIAGIRSAHAAGIGAIVAIGPAEERATLAGLPGIEFMIENLDEFPRGLIAASNEADVSHSERL